MILKDGETVTLKEYHFKRRYFHFLDFSIIKFILITKEKDFKLIKITCTT